MLPKPSTTLQDVMLIEVTRRENERFESLYRRFSRLVQETGLLREVKKVRFYEPELSRRKRREQARRRLERRVLRTQPWRSWRR